VAPLSERIDAIASETESAAQSGNETIGGDVNAVRCGVSENHHQLSAGLENSQDGIENC